jgi:hypothetical protein
MIRLLVVSRLLAVAAAEAGRLLAAAAAGRLWAAVVAAAAVYMLEVHFDAVALPALLFAFAVLANSAFGVLVVLVVVVDLPLHLDHPAVNRSDG